MDLPPRLANSRIIHFSFYIFMLIPLVKIFLIQIAVECCIQQLTQISGIIMPAYPVSRTSLHSSCFVSSLERLTTTLTDFFLSLINDINTNGAQLRGRLTTTTKSFLFPLYLHCCRHTCVNCDKSNYYSIYKQYNPFRCWSLELAVKLKPVIKKKQNELCQTKVCVFLMAGN